MKKSAYIKELRRFWKKKLAHIKKPRERKRKIVDRHAFATAALHRRQGVPTPPDTHTNGLKIMFIVFDELNDAQP